MMKYTQSDMFDGVCTTAQYYDQFEKPSRLEVGKVYRQKGFVYYCDYLVVWADDVSAVGEIVRDGNGGSNVGQRDLFKNSGSMLGWRVRDQRSDMRLTEI